MNTPQNEKTIRSNEIETETEPISPDWRQRQQNKGKSPMMGNPSTRRTERITKQSNEPNWRSRKWEKPIQEFEFPSIVPRTEMSIKLENDDEQNQRSRLKELITQRLEAQSIALATEQENQRNQRSRLEEIIKRRIESQSIAQTQTPFIEEMESDEEDEESETEEEYKRRREFIHAYLTMDNENKREKQEETETDEGIVGTPKEQKRRLIHAYLTSTMEKGENEREQQNNRRELLRAYSKRTMDNDEDQTEQDETCSYLRTSMEEEQEPSTWEEYEEEPFKENDDEGKWMTQFSYPAKEEEDALFLAFMSGTVEDQKKWIDAKMNLARATTNEETRRREEKILNRIIPTEIVDLDEAFSEEDEEETDDLSENRPYDLDMDQEEDFILKDTKTHSFSLPGQEKSDEFIDEDQEEEDIQSLESLNISYRNHRRQNKETVNSLTTEPDEQLDKARYFTELDVRWKYDNGRIVDEDQWKKNFETNQAIFEPMTIFSYPYSPTISQTMIKEIFQDEQNELQNIVNRDYDIRTKEQDTENTQCVLRRSGDDDLFAEPEGHTSWVTKTEYEGMLNPENQPQTESIKDVGIDEWPTPTTTEEVKSFLGFGSFDEEFTQNNEDLMKPQDRQNESEQNYDNIVILPEELFPSPPNHESNDERTFEKGDEQVDPITTLSVHGPKTLPNHFSKVAAATSVNDVIAVNVMNRDLRKWTTMAQNMDMIVNYAINLLSGRKPNMWEDIFKDWLIWKDTALTNHSTLRHSKPTQILNRNQARQSLFLSGQPDRYLAESTDNQDEILLPGETIIKTVDEKVYRSIKEGNYRGIPVWNIFDAPTRGILLPWNLRMSWKKDLGIHLGLLLTDLSRPLNSGMVVEDHGSTEDRK